MRAGLQPALLFLAWMLLSFLAASCASLRDAPPELRPLEFGGALLQPDGTPAGDEVVEALFRQADYVLIGERHDQTGDHAAQAVVLDRLAQMGLKPTLGMEMLDLETQPELDKFNAGELGAPGLPRSLNWPSRVGLPFELYRTLFEVAARESIPVYALNPPRRVVRTARLNGLAGVPPEDRRYLPERFMLASPEQQTELRRFFNAHPGPRSMDEEHSEIAQPLTEERIQGFILAQSLWDSVMAEQGLRRRRERPGPLVILAGIGHVERGWGIALRLRALDPHARIVNILPWRASGIAQEESNPDGRGQDAQDEGFLYYYSPFPAPASGRGFLTAMRDGQLEVLAVEPGSPADQAGLRSGDLILRLGLQAISSQENFYYLLARGAAFTAPVELIVRRDGQNLPLTLPTP
ncbi:MAG: ChaN family lipoprotein [Desulfovibrionaceae bacterium]|nr:ChaN family lipoprotein [Desulfovibrionaceae bacterium]